jgi:protein-S-isoprenylcysteine O-methyltransferase Ste14
MRASVIEFRLRVLIMVVIIAVGAWSPWVGTLGSGRRISLLEWLALELSRLGLVSFTVATPLVIVVASLVALTGAFLRIWGTAWLGADIVHNASMKAGELAVDGPFRYVRNPLYLGSICMVTAVAFTLPPTGALFVAVLLAVLLIRLILAEETFLRAQLGPIYQEFHRAVPRLIPRLRTNLPRTCRAPQWGAALLAEVFPIGVFVTLAVLSWRYNNLLLIKAILVSFGLSLVARALIPSVPNRPAESL